MTKKEWIIITIVKLWKKSSKLIFFKIEGKKNAIKAIAINFRKFFKNPNKKNSSKSKIILIKKENLLKSFDI